MNGTASKKRGLSKRGKQPTYRRIVTGNVNGKSIVQSDEPLRAYQFKSVPNYEHTLVSVNPTTYFSIPSGGERAINAVWAYEAPNDAVAAIRNCLAFYPERVDAIEERPQ